MHVVQASADLNASPKLASSRGSAVHEEFTDTTTWDEIIQILEEEALRKFAIAER